MRNRFQVFESCLTTYCDCISRFFRIRTVNPAAQSKGRRRPYSPGASDFASDFVIVGREALASRESAARFFEVFFVQAAGLNAERVAGLLGISRATFEARDHEVREIVGGAFRRAGLWPKKRYFQMAAERRGGIFDEGKQADRQTG